MVGREGRCSGREERKAREVGGDRFKYDLWEPSDLLGAPVDSDVFAWRC